MGRKFNSKICIKIGSIIKINMFKKVIWRKSKKMGRHHIRIINFKVNSLKKIIFLTEGKCIKRIAKTLINIYRAKVKAITKKRKMMLITVLLELLQRWVKKLMEMHMIYLAIPVHLQMNPYDLTQRDTVLVVFKLCNSTHKNKN